MKNLKILLLFILLFIFSNIFYFVSPVFSETQNGTGGTVEEIDSLKGQIDARKNKIAELEKSIAEFKKKIEAKRLESVSLSNQITILDTRVAELNADIDVAEEKLQVLQLEITSNELLIKQKTEQLNRQKGIIAELVRSLHQQDGKNYIEIVATNDNFSDFYNQLHYTQSVQEDLGKTMRGVKIAKQELENKKKELEGQKANFLALSLELKEKKKDFEEQSSVKQNLLVDAQSSELKYKTLLGTLKKQYQQVEGEINSFEREVRKKLQASKKITPPSDADTGTGQLAWPTPSRYITAYFHDPSYPFRNVFEHSAIDIRAAQGTPIKAAASGYVARAKKCTLASCYSYILLVHDGNLSTVYGHMSKIMVTEDQFVTRGDIIGYSGGTPGTVGAGPFVTGAHLHFEVRKDGIPVNPLSYVE